MLMAEIERVLALPARDALHELATLREGQWFERKSARIAPRDLAVPLIAMANAEGGYVAVGFRDGQPEGISQSRINEFRQAALKFTQPVVPVTAVELPLSELESVLILQVEPGDHLYTTTGGDCYLRIGDVSRKLSYAERQSLEHDRGLGPFDGKTVDVTVADLNQELLDDYRELLGSSSIDAMLHARFLVDRRQRVTVAALLLFADTPQLEFPSAHVRVLRYSEPYRGAGADHTLYEGGDTRFTGPLPQQIRQATALIAEWMPKRRALLETGLFGPVPLVPESAWREGLVNAVLHRNYANQGDHIRVEVFPDRIEIANPGHFPTAVDPADPDGVRRQARNPRIVRVCADLGIGEELGEGIRRMYQAMRNAGLNDPLYEDSGESVRLTLLFAKREDPKLSGDLTAKALAVLDVLRREAVPLSTGEIAELVSVARPTAGRHLKRLQELGLVQRSGGATRDPTATWSVTPPQV